MPKHVFPIFLPLFWVGSENSELSPIVVALILQYRSSLFLPLSQGTSSRKAGLTHPQVPSPEPQAARGRQRLLNELNCFAGGSELGAQAQAQMILIMLLIPGTAAPTP